MIHYNIVFKGKDKGEEPLIGTFYDVHNVDSVQELLEDFACTIMGKQISITIDEDPQGLISEPLE